MTLHVDTNISAGYALPVGLTAAQIFGKNLVRLRDARELTQEQLAAKLGKRQSTISNMESGKSGMPKILTLRHIALVLECTIDDLLKGIEAAEPKRRTPRADQPRRKRAV